VIAYIALAREHQHAIHELVRLGLYGSAFALLRPLFETGVRALWVLGLASDEQVEAIGRRGEEPFPKFTSMCELVDACFSAEGVFNYFRDGLEGDVRLHAFWFGAAREEIHWE